jgi:general stress protein 26
MGSLDRQRLGRGHPDQPAHRQQEGTPVNEPDTTLDQRFSDPDAAVAGWDETRRVLEEAQLSWICTVRADGRPHLTPLVAVWLDGALYFCTGAGEQKAVNLRGHPHVLLLTGCHRWDEGLDVVAEGDAVQVTDDALLTRLAQAWARKWDGQWQFQVRDGAFQQPGGGEGAALVFEVRPAKVLAFAKGRFGQTRHSFS